MVTEITPGTDSKNVPSDAEILIDVRNVKIYFSVTAGFLIQRKIAENKDVDGISFQVKKGETLGLVGESGCGKSTTGRAILQLYRPTAGEILFDGKDLVKMRGNDLRLMRRKMQMIFQDPYASLNPRMSVRDIIGEPLVIHKMGTNNERRDRVLELMRIVGLNPYYATRFPHEFSGGQRQRIGIARALAVSPDFIVCDEPVSALDVSIQAQIINLLEELQEQFGLTYLFIAHDLAVVRHISDRVPGRNRGSLRNQAAIRAIYDNPRPPSPRRCFPRCRF